MSDEHQFQEGTEVIGNDVIALVNVGTQEEPDWRAVGSQTGYSKEQTAERITQSSKRSRTVPGRSGNITRNVTIEALYVPDTEAAALLEDAFDYGEKIMIREAQDEQHVRQGIGNITSLGESHALNEGSTRSIEIALDNWDWI